MRKLLSILVTLALTLTLMSAAAITVSAAPTYLTDVNVGYQTPTGGFTVDEIRGSYDFYLGYLISYDATEDFFKPVVENPSLDNPTDWALMGDSEEFVLGGDYAIQFTVTLNASGYEFDPSVEVVTYKGVKATVLDVQTNQLTFVVLEKDIKGLPEGTYGLTVGNTPVTPKNAANILGDKTAWYDPNTNTLTLNGSTIKSGYEVFEGNFNGIYSKNTLKIVVKGNVTIDISGRDATDVAYSTGIYVDNGALSLSGDGNLTVKSGDAQESSAAIYGRKGISLYFGGDWSFSSGAASFDSAALYSSNLVSLEAAKVGATLTLSGRTNDILASSLLADDFTVQASATYGGLKSDVDWAVYYPTFTTYSEVILTAVEPTEYGLTVAGVPVDATNKGNILGDKTASYDPATKTLTLNNAKLTKAFTFTSPFFSTGTNYAAILTTKPLTINLSGDNVIDTSTFAFSAPDRVCGIVADTTRLSITGDGNLTVKAVDAPSVYQEEIFATNDLFVDMKGNLTITADKDQQAYGMVADQGMMELNMAGKWTIDIGESSSTYLTTAIIAGRALTIQNSGTGTVKFGNRPNAKPVAVYAQFGDINIVNDGTLTVTAGDAGSGDSVALYGNYDVNIINDGTLTVTAGDAADDSYAICASQNLSIDNGGTVTVACGDAADDSDAIEVSNNASLTGNGKMTVTTGDGKYTSAIYCDYGSLVIGGGKGTYTFTSGTSQDWGATLYACNGIEIKDDVSVTISAEKSVNNDLYGIDSDADLIISTSGDVTVTVGKAAGDSCGLYAFNDASLIGSGDLTVTAGKAGYTAYGVYASHNVEIDGSGNVSLVTDATSNKGYGIFVGVGDISFAGTNLGNKIYAEGGTQAVNKMPTFDPDAYATKGSETLPAELKDIALNVTTYKDYKAIELTSLVKTVNDVVLGDADGDGFVTMKDVLLSRKYIAGLVGDADLNLAAADADGDGFVTMKDVLLMRKAVAGLVTL